MSLRYVCANPAPFSVVTAHRNTMIWSQKRGRRADTFPSDISLRSVRFGLFTSEPVLKTFLHLGEWLSYAVHVDDVDILLAQMVVAIRDGRPRDFDPADFHVGAQHAGLDEFPRPFAQTRRRTVYTIEA